MQCSLKSPVESQGAGFITTRYLQCLVIRQGSHTQVRLDSAELGEELLGLLVRDGGSDNDVIARHPVNGGGHTVLVTGLERVNNTQNLSSVAASGGRVGQDQTNGLLGVNDEH